MANKDKEAGEGRRSFEYSVDGSVKKFYLGMPNSEQIRKAEWHYSKVYNKALVEGVATSSEMMDILTRRGIYGPEYEKKLQDLQVEIAVTIAEMHNEEDEDKKVTLARKVEKLRDDLYRWNQRLTGPLSNSCEQMAEDAKTEYLTSVVVQNEDGSPAWGSYEDFVSEENQGLALKARFEVMLWLQGLEADFLDKTPEQRVIQEMRRSKDAANKETPKLAAPADADKDTDKTPKKKRTRRKNAASKTSSKKTTAE